MPKYQIVGRDKKTGRRKRHAFYASGEAEARRVAEKKGTVVETVDELPPEFPTESQRLYAAGLGIELRADTSSEEISRLITAVLDGGGERERAIQKACHSSLVLSIFFSNRGKDAGWRIVEPYTLVDTPSGHTAVLCWQTAPRLTGERWRTFRLDHIAQVRLSAEHFQRRIKLPRKHGSVLTREQSEAIRRDFRSGCWSTMFKLLVLGGVVYVILKLTTQ